MKQTAVDYLVKELSAILGLRDLLMVDPINKAKQMEKQQIIDAFNQDLYSQTIDKMKYQDGEQYYNETYKNQQTKWYITLANGEKNGLSLKTNHRVKENYQQWKNTNIK